MFIGEYDYDLDMQVKAEEARERGLAEGHAEGLAKGLAEGQQQKAIEDAKNMLKKNYPTSDISEITGLPLDQVLEMQKQISVTA